MVDRFLILIGWREGPDEIPFVDLPRRRQVLLLVLWVVIFALIMYLWP